VYLAARTRERLDRLAEKIRSGGGRAEAGQIDISFNAIGYGDVQQPLTGISVDDFLHPIVAAMRSQFLTTRAAAHMVPRGSGVILAFGGGTQTLPGLGGFKIALDALEGLRRQLACELGPRGIRVVTLKSGGAPETLRKGFLGGTRSPPA
jgi:NAD(P)-dependent dehydrogenase (short-subunit alcohol dehydrogenase family)